MKTEHDLSPKTDTLRSAFLELVRRTACEIPDDVKDALDQALKAEKSGSGAELCLSRFLENIEMAKVNTAPLCQDTGTPIFHIHHPQGQSNRELTDIIHHVLKQATQKQYLRPNAVDPVTGQNSGTNVGAGFPQTFFFEWDAPHFEIGLMLKGGGCENVGAQYSLPYDGLDAGRDLEGVRRVFWMRCAGPRARAVLPASWGYVSEEIVGPATSSPRGNCSAFFLMLIPCPRWRNWSAAFLTMPIS